MAHNAFRALRLLIAFFACSFFSGQVFAATQFGDVDETADYTTPSNSVVTTSLGAFHEGDTVDASLFKSLYPSAETGRTYTVRIVGKNGAGKSDGSCELTTISGTKINGNTSGNILVFLDSSVSQVDAFGGTGCSENINALSIYFEQFSQGFQQNSLVFVGEMSGNTIRTVLRNIGKKGVFHAYLIDGIVVTSDFPTATTSMIYNSIYKSALASGQQSQHMLKYYYYGTFGNIMTWGMISNNYPVAVVNSVLSDPASLLSEAANTSFTNGGVERGPKIVSNSRVLGFTGTVISAENSVFDGKGQGTVTISGTGAKSSYITNYDTVSASSVSNSAIFNNRLVKLDNGISGTIFFGNTRISKNNVWAQNHTLNITNSAFLANAEYDNTNPNGTDPNYVGIGAYYGGGGTVAKNDGTFVNNVFSDSLSTIGMSSYPYCSSSSQTGKNTPGTACDSSSVAQPLAASGYNYTP